MTIEELQQQRDHYARLTADGLVNGNTDLAKKWAQRSEEYAVQIRSARALDHTTRTSSGSTPASRTTEVHP